MRYGIFSDVHANLEALTAVIGAYRKEAIDVILCAGDIVGYGANPNECIEEVKKISRVTVAGNHDWASVDKFSVDYFNQAAKLAIFWTKAKLADKSFLSSLELVYKNQDLTLVHGTLRNPQDFNYLINEYLAKKDFDLLETDACFLGHSHIAGVFIQKEDKTIYYSQHDLDITLQPGNKYIVNVGSVGQPRDNNPEAAYCIYDTERKRVEIKRVAYEVGTAGKKIIEGGLPRFLADRLAMGN